MTRKTQSIYVNRIAAGGVHCCHFYHGLPHLLATVVPLVQAALRQNARCTLSLGTGARRGVACALEAAGYDMARLKRQGQLELTAEPQVAGINSTAVLSADQQLQELEEKLCQSGFTYNLRICQADLPLMTMDWETYIIGEGAVTVGLEGRRISVLCLFPFTRVCMGPYYDDIRAVHPQLLSAGRLLDYKGSLVGGTR